MNEALLPLHVTVVGGHFLPGLLTLIIVVLFLKFLRHGGIGPVRWAPGGGPAQHRGPAGPAGPRGHRGRWAGAWDRPSPEEEALARLAERLAAGDITPEEYLERSTVLRGSTPPKEG